MGLALWTNNAETTVAVQLLIAATSLTVSAGDGDYFPAIAVPGDWFKVTLVDSAGNREIVKCTLRPSGTDVFTILRAQEGTSARQWEIDDIVSHRVTAEELGLIITDIDDNKTDIASNDSDILNHEGRIAALENDLEAPTGTKLYFYSDTPPAGWTYDSGVTDRILSVKGGSDAYNVSGGSQAGSWTQPNHALITSELAAHTHGSGNTGSGGGHGHTFGGATPRYGSSGSDGTFGIVLSGGSATSYSSVTINSSAGHTHTINSEGGGGSHNHGTTYRPYGAVGIIATKD